MIRSVIRCSVVVTLVTLVSASPAPADFWKNLGGGLQYLADPSGFGAINGGRTGFMAFDYNRLSDGWRVDWSKTFGPDRFGRPHRIDVGPAQLTFNSGTLSWTADYNKRLLPGVNFDIATPAPINYTYELNTGFQDLVTINSQLSLAGGGNINLLGFYDFQLQIVHTGAFESDGLVEDSGHMNFDVGPIDVSGNIFIDLVTGAFEAIGVPPEDLAPIKGFPTKTKNARGLVLKLLSGQPLSEQEMLDMVSTTVLASMEPPVPDGAVLGATALADPAEGSPASIQLDAVPEPATLALLLGALGWAIRRR